LEIYVGNENGAIRVELHLTFDDDASIRRRSIWTRPIGNGINLIIDLACSYQQRAGIHIFGYLLILYNKWILFKVFPPCGRFFEDPEGHICDSSVVALGSSVVGQIKGEGTRLKEAY